MTFTVEKQPFESIKEFTTYLEATYEQDAPVSREVIVSIAYDAFSQEHRDELVKFLLEPERMVIYKLEFLPHDDTHQIAIDNAYLAKKRQRFSLDFQQQINELFDSAPIFQAHNHKVRTTKKNWIEGSKVLPVGLHLRQPNSLVPQPAPQKAGQRKHAYHGGFAQVAVIAAEKVPSDTLGELVDRMSLDTGKWDQFAKHHFKKKTPNLGLIWERLVGKNVAKVGELDRKITHVQKAAMEQIIRNYAEFSYGLVFDNLPPGFYLRQTDDDKAVLCFSEELQYQHREQINPLTLIPTLSVTANPTGVGSYEQFSVLKKDSVNFSRYKIEFAGLFASQATEKQRKEAFMFFLAELCDDNLPKLKQIQQLLEKLPLTECHYQGLAQVLIHGGPDALLLLLHHFKTLDEKQRFKGFNELFLKKPENFISLISESGFANLKNLSALSQEQQNWWVSLVVQHKDAGAHTDFNDLFAAYDYFLNELEKQQVKLPVSCALEPIRHMKLALDRLLFIVGNSSDPQEQLNCLDGLDFDMYGAYFASRYNDYRLVSRQMNLSPDSAEHQLDYSTANAPHGFHEQITHFASSYTQTMNCFYRFIGQQEWAYSLDVYQKIEQEITKNQHLDKQAKTLLLDIVALTTTGQRACAKTEDPYSSCKKLFATLAPENHLSILIPIISELLSKCNWRSMPTVDELNQLIDAWLLVHPDSMEPSVDDFKERITLGLGLIARFDDAFTPFINNHQKRFRAEQTKALCIASFSLNDLLSHLGAHSKLDRYLSDLFADQPVSLSSFIVLLSLLSDQVPAATKNGENDSDFETKIKTLAQDLYTMPAGRRGQLLAILTDINIEGSYYLPSLEQLLKIVSLVTEQEEQLNRLPGAEAQKERVLKLVNTELPHTKIGNAKLTQSDSTLFSLMKKSLDELQLEHNLEQIPEKLQEDLEPWQLEHQHVMRLIEREPINIERVLDALIDEDQEVKNLLNGWFFSRSLSSYPQAKVQMAQFLGVDLECINEFFTTKSLLVLLKPRIQATCQASLSRAVTSLQTGNRDVDDFLLNQMKDINTKAPIKDALLEASEQFDAANGLINAFIHLKNKSNIDFHRCISLIAEEIKPTSSARIMLSVAQMAKLMDSLGQASDSAAASLATVCTLLKQNPDYSTEQLNKALSEVNSLSQYAKTMEPRAYETLLSLSFTYNLTHKSLFPLQKLFNLESSTSSKDLSDAFLNVVQHLGPDVDDKILKEVIDKTSAVIQAKAGQVPTLLPALTLFIKACEKCNKEELLRYQVLIDKLTAQDVATLNHWTKILTILGDHAIDINIQLLLDLQEGLALHPLDLSKIASLFEYPPYPEIESMKKVLHGYVNNLRDYIDAFDKDPKSTRTPQKNAFGIVQKTKEQILNEQFDTTCLARVIAQLSNPANGLPLSGQEQYDLAQQITYINAIGKDKSVTISKMDDLRSKQINTYHDLTQISRSELRNISDTLIGALRKPMLDADEKLKNQLRLLAVLREQYCRATGIFVNTTELITLLLSIKNQQNTIVAFSDTDVDTSAINAILAVMQWVETDGATVDVCCENRGLLAQNYGDKGGANFFASLAIPSSKIEANSPKGTYKPGGINYSTLADLALYRYRAQVEDEPLTVGKKGHFVSSNLMINVTDFSKLNGKTLFSTARNVDEAHADNSYAWVYPVINVFVNQTRFKTLDPVKGWNEAQELSHLREFLDKYAATAPDKERLSVLSDQQFHLWINAAIEAQRLVEGEDFNILSSKTALHVAVPLNQRVEQDGFGFGRGVQHFLHARLQKEYPEWQFVIEPEPLVVDAVSVQDVFDDYKKHGRIIGISGPLSVKNELVQQRGYLNVDAVSRIPSHQEEIRDDLVIPPVTNQDTYLYVYSEIIKHAKNGRPILIIAKDVDEVRLLQKQLTPLLETMSVRALTGRESEKDRVTWLKEKAGTNNTVTISTPLLGQYNDLNTKKPEGILTVQTSLDTSDDTLQFINSLTQNNNPGEYVAIYDDCGEVFAESWPYQSHKAYKKIVTDLTNLQKQQREGAAVERYYRQRVSDLQQVVLRQFDEWKEFLHLVYPKAEWRKIDAELIIQREDLILSLQEQWQECLEHSLPEKRYHNPYVRRDANKKIQTKGLDETVHAYENAVSTIWNKHRAELKKKADGRFEDGSINALRCQYLDDVSLNDQIQSYKLQTGANKKEIRADKKKARRYVRSGLEVSGAMLRYSDGDVQTYRTEFEKTLVKLFAADISTRLMNTTALSKTVRSILVQQVNSARSLNALISLLVNYGNRYLPEDRFAEKYTMQPIVQELLWTYQHIGLEKTEALQQLKEIYLHNVSAEIVVDLETALSWAMEGSRGLGYLLERSAVKTAANAILLAVEQLKAAKDRSENQIAVKNLYKVLAQHEAKLEDIWIFSFGHKNTRTLIKQTLATLDSLTAIGSDENELDADFIHDCKEEAHYDLLKEKLAGVVKVIATDKFKGLQNNAEWKSIIKTLTLMQSESNNAYALQEMHSFLAQKGEDLAKRCSKLQGPVAQLRREIRSIFDEFSHNHKDLLNKSKYFAHKAEKLKTKLTGLDGFKVGGVQLNLGTNGFSDYCDLIIEGSNASHPLFADFTQYHSRSQDLTKRCVALDKKLRQESKQITTLDKLISEQLPLLKSSTSTKTHAARFPEQFQAQVNELLTMKEWLVDQVPGDLSAFSRDVQDSFYDRQLVKTLKFPDLQAEEIAKLKNITLRMELEALREKIVAAAKPKSMWVNLTSYVASYLFTPETMDDWRLEFNYWVGSPERKVHSVLALEIKNKQTVLVKQLSMLRQQVSEQAETITQQVTFLREKIKEEHAKSGIYVKRFTSPTELSTFEMQLTAVLAKQKEQAINALPKSSDDDLLHLLDLVPNSEEFEEDISERYSFT